MYKDEPAGRTILGPIENIKNINQEDFIQYKKEHYVAKGTTVVVSGNFDQGKVIKEIKDLFKDIPVSKKIKRKKTKFSQSKPQVSIKYKKTDQTHLLFGISTFPIKDKRNTTLSLLSIVLGGGMSSRLFTEMRDKRGLCYYTFAYADRSTDRGILAVGSGVGNKRLEESVEVIMTELKKLRDEEISPKELKKSKDYLIGNLAMSLEGSDDIAMSLGMQELLKGDIKKLQKKFSDIRKVTSKDIQKLAKQIFVNDRLNFSSIGPLKEDKAIKKLLKF
jgi:predicted Zn-dependent peptidase